MSTNFFDEFGWFTTDSSYSSRVADSAPESIPASKVVGELYPNWTGYVWSMMPYQLPPVEPTPPVVPETRHITKLAFRNRFTTTEKVTIEIACLDDPTAPMAQRQMAAALRSSQSDINAATYIDLDRQDTRDGVLALEAAGLLAAGRALIILDAVIQAEEKPK